MNMRALLAAALVFAVPGAACHALELRPTTLQLQAGQGQTELWIINEQPTAWQGRISIHHWDQSSGRDQLRPASGIVASPARPIVPAGTRQRVRLVLPTLAPVIAGPEGGLEQAFRVLVEPADPAQPRFSLPLFITPATAARASVSVAPMSTEGPSPCLPLHNRGSRRARLMDLSFISPDGATTLIQPGLSGYVLAGARVCWPLPEAATRYAGGRFQARREGRAAEVLEPIAAPASAGL